MLDEYGPLASCRIHPSGARQARDTLMITKMSRRLLIFDGSNRLAIFGLGDRPTVISTTQIVTRGLTDRFLDCRDGNDRRLEPASDDHRVGPELHPEHQLARPCQDPAPEPRLSANAQPR